MLTESEPHMYHIVDSTKPFEQASADLEAAVKRNGFGVLHIHDLGATLRGKGIDFQNECRVFEVCNPAQANKVMSLDMRLNMALPCRISVYTDGGITKLGMVRPADMLASLSTEPTLLAIADDVEKATKTMIDEAASMSSR